MKKKVPYLLPLIFLALLVGANIYMANRVAWFFHVELKTAFDFLFPFLTVYMIIGVIGLANASGFLPNLFYRFAAFLMGFLLYLLLAILLVDFSRLFTSFSPEIYGLTAFSLAFLVSVAGIINALILRVTKHKIPIQNLSGKIRAMHISDVHLSHFRGKKYLQKIVNKTKAENPDVVFITGDLFDGRARLKPETLTPLKEITVPIYFIEGNHDKYTGVKTIKKMLRDGGIKVLENETELFGELQITGLNHMRATNNSVPMHATGGEATISNVLPKLKIEKNKPAVLLHHSPDGIEYAGQNGYNIYLAGHTHGGQIFPFTYITKSMFKIHKGFGRNNGLTTFVSQGAGTFGPPMRVGTFSEITLLELVPGTAK